MTFSSDYYSQFITAFEPRNKKSLGDQYSEYDKHKKTGAPTPLSDRPIICRMTDKRLTLSWKPSVPTAPRFPVTYQVAITHSDKLTFSFKFHRSRKG